MGDMEMIKGSLKELFAAELAMPVYSRFGFL
jgi:hypothetical protein